MGLGSLDTISLAEAREKALVSKVAVSRESIRSKRAMRIGRTLLSKPPAR